MMSRERTSPTAKEAIEALLVILKTHASASSSSSSFISSSLSTSTLDVTAELLRRGKHNVEEASPPLWRFLHDFLRTFFKPPLSTRQSLCLSASSSSPRTAMIEDVKTHLVVLGYPGVDALLPFQEEERQERLKGRSRELTLAFGWLLTQFQILARLFPFWDNCGIEGSSSKIKLIQGEGINLETVLRMDINEAVASALKMVNQGLRSETSQVQQQPQQQQLKQLQWELGKLNLTRRKWIQTRLKRESLERKVSSLTRGFGLSTGDGKSGRSDMSSKTAPSSAVMRSDESGASQNNASTTSRHAALPTSAASPRSAALPSCAAPPRSAPPSRSVPADESTSSDSLTATEAILLSNPSNYEEASKMLDAQLRYLKAWLLWRDGGGSKVFWKWMESIVEAKEVEGRGGGASELDNFPDVEDEGESRTSIQSNNALHVTARLAETLRVNLTAEMKNIHSTLATSEERIKDLLCNSNLPLSRNSGDEEQQAFLASATDALMKERLNLCKISSGESQSLTMFQKEFMSEKDTLLGQRSQLQNQFDAAQFLDRCLVLPPLSSGLLNS